MASAEVAATVRAARKAQASVMSGHDVDPDIENEDEIRDTVSPQAQAAIKASLAQLDADPADADGEDDEPEPVARGSVPKVKAKVDMLDRSQSLGFVSPPENSLDDPPRLAHFFQNAKYYDANGYRVKMPGDEENDKARAAEMERTRKRRAKRLRIEAEMLDQGIEPETPDEDVVSGDVNLTQWALFQRDYRFAEVRKAVATRYSRVIPTEDEARNFLIDEGVVTEDQVRTAVRRGMAAAGRLKVG